MSEDFTIIIPKEYKILLALTFVFGMFTGVYLYISGFMPNYSKESHQSSLKASLVIDGLEYGACEFDTPNSCASYRLLNDGSLLVQRRAGQQSVKIPSGTIDALNKLIDSKHLETYVEALPENTCAEGTGKSRFVLTAKDTKYILDSCTTNFPKASPLANILNSFFNY